MKEYEFFINGQRIVVSRDAGFELPKEYNEFQVPPKQDLRGTISWDVKDKSALADTIASINVIAETRKQIIDNLRSQINKYFEKKINEYLNEHCYNFMDWSRFGAYKSSNNKFEYYFMGEFICGIKMVETINEETLESKLELEYY